jgi:Ni,Fe-hydrogenase I large subunit
MTHVKHTSNNNIKIFEYCAIQLNQHHNQNNNNRVKTQSKELKQHFLMFEISKGKLIVWIIIKNFEIFFVNCKVYMFKV